MKTKFYIPLLVGFLFIRCMPTKTISFNAESTQADVAFPVEFKNIRIINRTIPRDRNFIDVLTDGQGLAKNQKGVSDLLNGFTSGLRARKYFDIKYPIKEVEVEESINFPEPFAYDDLLSFFDFDTTSIIASLEVFQVTEDINYINDRKMQLDPDGKEYYIDIVKGTNTLRSVSGWRLYNSKTGEVLDEFLLNHDYAYEVEGIDLANAKEKLKAKKDQGYIDLGKELGNIYAERVSPLAVVVNRSIYVKSKSCPELHQAKDFIKLNDWETAKAIWQDGLLSNSKAKDLAKLHVNIAVYYERLGDIENAIKHAELSVNYDTLGSTYLSKLKKVEQNGYQAPISLISTAWL